MESNSIEFDIPTKVSQHSEANIPIHSQKPPIPRVKLEYELEPSTNPDIKSEVKEGEPVLASNEQPSSEPSIEDQARASGWLPKDEYTGDPATWKPADRFVENGSFFKKIASQNAELRELKQHMSRILDTLSKSEERSYQKAMSDIQNKLKSAEALGDVTAYKQATQAAQQVQNQYDNISKSNVSQQPIQVQDWLKKHTWFESDKTPAGEEARATAQALSTAYAKIHSDKPGYSIEAELAYVDKMLPRSLPDYAAFKSVEDAPAKVSGIINSSKPRGSSSTSNLSLDARIARLDPMDRQTATYLKNNRQDVESYIKAKEKGSR